MTEGRLRTARMAKRILEHFLHYPESGDSVVGIARWGLEDAQLPAPTEAVQEALASLLSRGFLVELVAPGMRPIYRLKLGSEADAERWLTLVDEREDEA
jgi:hypothetical protein